jgi:Cap4 SAVED domain
MEWLKTRVENLIFKFSAPLDKGKWERFPIHLNYESGKYRQSELRKIIYDALPHFALTPDEFEEYTLSKDPGELYRVAWSRISKRNKYKKGDYGELLLFLILKVFFDSDKLVTKIKLKSGNQEIYGYDCAHFTIEGEEPVLWLGESKFHSTFANAITDAFKSLDEHCKSSFTRSEFSFLEPHIEVNKTSLYYQKLRIILKNIKSFDELKIKIPVFITYNSNKIVNHKNHLTPEFISEFQQEFNDKYSKIDSKTLALTSNFELIFILLPLEVVKDLKDELDTVEKSHR